ncbi:MAG: RNA 2'-phosphotransferase [Velocimicrobium sp.]
MNYNELSKEVSYALRHAPWEYELEMDGEGWVSISQLIDALRSVSKWENININDLHQMIVMSEKKRHEIVLDKIRAFYGHSLPIKIYKEEQKPPQILYHGTTRRFEKSIFESGLLPQARQYVHLSQEVDTAIQVGKRRDEHPVILLIDAEKAYEQGAKFYYGNEKVWLADYIPAKYIRKH